MMIWVRLRDHPNKQVFISESSFDPKKHIKPSKEEEENIKESHSLNIKMICKTKSAPGMHFKIDTSRGSLTYNGKLDPGATDELLERGLDGAKKRAKEREKKTGHAFRKMKTGKLVPRKAKRRK
jgi:hypothetical protein